MTTYTPEQAKAIAEAALPKTAVLKSGLGNWAVTVSARELADLLNHARQQGGTDATAAIVRRIDSPAIQGLRALCVKIAAEDEGYPEADMNLDMAQELCDHTPEIIALLDDMQRAGGFVPGR